MSLQHCIVDLDNCVSDDHWRLELINLELPVINDRYKLYHEYCHLDTPGESRDYVLELAKRYKLIVFTSRPEAVRSKTLHWLEKWNIPTTQLFMRYDNDHRSSVLIKRTMLRMARQYHNCNVQFAIDDRQDILDMYLAEGVPSVKRIALRDIPLSKIEGVRV